MTATWPPPPDLASIKELTRDADIEGFIAGGSPTDEYDTEAEELFNSFHEVLTTEVPIGPELGKLAALGGVRKFPMRVKCATLAWHTMMNALGNGQEPASTE